MKNVGIIDRTIRTIIGIALLIFAWWYEGQFIFSIIAAIGGVSMLLTAITGYCFIFRAMGVSTMKEKKDNNVENQ